MQQYWLCRPVSCLLLLPSWKQSLGMGEQLLTCKVDCAEVHVTGCWLQTLLASFTCLAWRTSLLWWSGWSNTISCAPVMYGFRHLTKFACMLLHVCQSSLLWGCGGAASHKLGILPQRKCCCWALAWLLHGWLAQIAMACPQLDVGRKVECLSATALQQHHDISVKWWLLTQSSPVIASSQCSPAHYEHAQVEMLLSEWHMNAQGACFESHGRGWSCLPQHATDDYISKAKGSSQAWARACPEVTEEKALTGRESACQILSSNVISAHTPSRAFERARGRVPVHSTKEASQKSSAVLYYVSLSPGSCSLPSWHLGLRLCVFSRRLQTICYAEWKL